MGCHTPRHGRLRSTVRGDQRSLSDRGLPHPGARWSPPRAALGNDTKTAHNWCDLAAITRFRRHTIVGMLPRMVAQRPVDHRIAELAASQFGVVDRGQLRALGLSDGAIAHRVRVRRLHGVRRGVYAVGHPLLGAHGRWLAAVLACGPGAVLSHASAAALWELRPSDAVSVDVTVRGPSRRRGLHLRVHRARGLGADETTTESGIPVTTPARTILDLAAMLPTDRALERVLDRAEVVRATDVNALVAIADARTGHRAAARLRRVLADHTPGTTLTRSALEERMLALCRERGLPQPRVNDSVAGLEVDFLFAAQRVVVEADSWQHHRSRAAFERDRQRDATLPLAGHRVLRFTDRQMAQDPTTVAAAIRAALAAGARAPPVPSAIARPDSGPPPRERETPPTSRPTAGRSADARIRDRRSDARGAPRRDPGPMCIDRSCAAAATELAARHAALADALDRGDPDADPIAAIDSALALQAAEAVVERRLSAPVPLA